MPPKADNPAQKADPVSGIDWPADLKPPLGSATTTVWRQWYFKVLPEISRHLSPLMALKLPQQGSQPSKADIRNDINNESSILRIGLRMCAVAANAAPPPSQNSPAQNSPASSAGNSTSTTNPTANSSTSSTTTPPANSQARPDCNTERCENVATDIRCLKCESCCKNYECPVPGHISAKIRREREAAKREEAERQANSGAILSPATMAKIVTMFASRELQADQPSTTRTPAASGAGDPGPAPPGTVAEGPLRSVSDPSIVWFQVISAWKLYPFASDDTDRVTAALDHIAAAWSQRATLLFHKYFDAHGPADYTRRFFPKPPPDGITPDDWDLERSDRILAAATTNDHLMAILRAFARSRFVVPKKKANLFLLISPTKQTTEFHAINQAQTDTPKLDPANPVVQPVAWSSPLKAVWWMLFASSLRIGSLRQGLEQAVIDVGESHRTSHVHMFSPEPVWEVKYSQQALQRKRARDESNRPAPTQRPQDQTKTRRIDDQNPRNPPQQQQVAANQRTDQRQHAPSGGAGADTAAGDARPTHGGIKPTGKASDLPPLPLLPNGKVDWSAVTQQRKERRAAAAAAASTATAPGKNK